MDSSSTEVRLFVQHLAQWLGTFSQRQITESHAAIDRLGDRGRALCANPEFRRLLETHAARTNPPTDPDAALGALCSFLRALTSTDPFCQYRSMREGAGSKPPNA